MTYLQLYRFPIFILLQLALLIGVATAQLVSSRTLTLDNRSVVYAVSGGGRWGGFSHDQELFDKTSGKRYSKTYRTFCISNLFARPQKAIKVPQAHLVLPADGSGYYTLTAQSLSNFTLFFHRNPLRINLKQFNAWLLLYLSK